MASNLIQFETPIHHKNENSVDYIGQIVLRRGGVPWTEICIDANLLRIKQKKISPCRAPSTQNESKELAHFIFYV